MPSNETKIPMPDRPRGQYDWVLAQQTIANLRKGNEELKRELEIERTVTVNMIRELRQLQSKGGAN